MSYKFDIIDSDYRGNEFETMLEAMDELSIFSISQIGDGKVFEILERCDNYFAANLTAEQLKALGEELIKLSESQIPTNPDKSQNKTTQ